ncbi:hypothetical protein [Mycobacterium sp. 1245852.3]|uniref:hypothetical protein n=1 Tax=Mycobacterium sp. 1245852.3 TaxID=1856860 RepID=UPI000AC386B1|nr:hypothetical protein [Mycobacterium sp. 1245852.3]
MSSESARRPPAAPTPPRGQVTPEDVERYADEDQAREALDERRLRDEQPPHHH